MTFILSLVFILGPHLFGPSIEFDSADPLLFFEELSSRGLCPGFPRTLLSAPLFLLIYHHFLDLSMFMCTGLSPIVLISLLIYFLLYHDLDTTYIMMILQFLSPTQTFSELQTSVANISM